MDTTQTQPAHMQQAEPQKEHEWLQKLVGDWTYEAEAAMSADTPPDKFTGTESVRSIGDLWFVAEGQGEMPGGGAATTALTLGYDTRKQRYVGTWIGSMMTQMWVYEGELDPSERTLTLHTDGPSMITEGKTTKYREAIEFKTDDHRVFTSHMLGDDGTWQKMMTAHYHRKK